MLRERQLQSLIYLCDALSSLRDPVETAKILRDLLSPQEMTMIANRLQIAVLLLEGYSYQEIRKTLGVSESTISRISNWLEIRGDAYRALKRRTKLRSLIPNHEDSYQSPKNVSAQYLWPSTLISDLLAVMTKDNAYQILNILAEAKQKPELFRVLNSFREI